MENPTHRQFYRDEPCASAPIRIAKNCVELELTKKKKSAFFVAFILPERYFPNSYILSLFMVYSINFQIIYTFTYQKTFLHTLLLLIFKILESLQCILKYWEWLKRNTEQYFLLSGTFPFVRAYYLESISNETKL